MGVLVLVALGLLAYMALQVGALRGFGDKVKVQARLDDAAGLAEGAMVKVAGIDIGRVDSLAIEHDQAVVSMSLDPAAAVRRDAIVKVRARSVLGEKYVEVVPISRDAALAQDGDELQGARTPVEIDQLVNDLGPLVGAMDPKVLERSLSVLTEALDEDPERLARMLEDAEVLLDNGATASAELPGLVQETRVTLQSVRRVADQAGPVIARADRVVAQLETGTADLDTTRAEVDALLVETRQVVDDGGKLVGRLEARGDQLERILDNVEEIDKWELRRLLREEGIVVRLKSKEVVEDE